MIGLKKYSYIRFLLINLYFLLSARYAWGRYSIPEVKLEAFKPKGLRISIPNETGIRQFAFHGRINGRLKEIEPGELSKEVTEATDNFWVYYDPNVELRVGDYIAYWVFVQHNYFGYRKDNLIWEVKELVSESSLECQNSETTYNSKVACKGALIFHDSFDKFDSNKWQIEQYIPNSGPNFEFNYYSPECVKVEDSKLKITPVSKQTEMELRGILDLKQGCTSTKKDDCYLKQQAAFYLPPVKSGMIKSKFSFKYGKVEVTAKLPCGDWIYPEITLHPKDPSKEPMKIYIAYSRGNLQLSGNDEGSDIGGKMLFSGPCVSPVEPKRSEFLTSKMFIEPYCLKEHKFSIIWNPDQILSYVDDEHFGRLDVRNGFDTYYPIDSEFFFSLGVSVGGINDFPNDYISSNGKYSASAYRKPWRNKDVRQIKNFFQARNLWLQTWTNETSALIIDSIRVYAL